MNPLEKYGKQLNPILVTNFLKLLRGQTLDAKEQVGFPSLSLPLPFPSLPHNIWKFYQGLGSAYFEYSDIVEGAGRFEPIIF